MRGYDNVFQVPEGRVGRERFRLRHIKARATNGTRTEGIDQGLFIDDRSSGDIHHDNRVWEIIYYIGVD